MTWLLDLTWSGRVFRFASVPITVGGVDYVGGLVPSFTLGAEPGTLQRDVEVDLGELLFDVDVAEWQAKGRPLLGATAVLSTYDGSIKRARVSGQVEAAEVGEYGEPVALTLTWTAEDGARVVPVAAAVELNTWNNADAAVYGEPYPRVFGRPGHNIASVAGRPVTGGSPGVVVDDTGNGTALISDDAVVGTGNPRVLRLRGSTWTALTSEAPTVTTDGLGRTVTVIDGGSAGFFAHGDTVWVDWPYLSTGTTARRDSNAPILSFGDLLYWLAGESDATFDTSAWRSIPAALGGYDVGYYVDDDSSPLDIIENVCLPLLPLSVIPGADGLVPVVWRLDARTADVSLVEGGNVARVSRLRTETDEVATDIELAYAPRADDGQPYAVARADETTHPACAESYSWIGRRRLRLETQAVYDATTAHRIVGWLALSKGSIVERVRYEDWDGLDLEVGAVVSVTDTGLSLSGRIGHVVEVAYTGNVTEYVVAMYRLPGRDSLRA